MPHKQSFKSENMRTKQLLLTLTLVLGFFVAAHSQSTYKSAIGLRAGAPPAVTFKHFISDPGAIEAFVGFYAFSSYYSYVTLGATYQHHFPIGDIEGFRWFIGVGAGAQFWSYDYDAGYGSTSIAILGVGGVDYKFADIPLNLSVDAMPAFFFGSDLYYGSAFRGFGAVSARYTFR